MRKAAMTTQAWRVDRRTTRAIGGDDEGGVRFDHETGVEAMVLPRCQPERGARRAAGRESETPSLAWREHD